MENKLINQIWKKMTIPPSFDPSKLSSNDNIEDDITTVRKRMDRRGYMSMIALLCDIYLCGTCGYQCTHGGFSYPRLLNLTLFGFLGIVVIVGWWRAHRWEKAEIYITTKEYLQLSSQTIKSQILVMRRMFWGFYVFIIIANFVFFFGGKSIIQAEIFLLVSIVCSIMWIKARSHMNKTIEFYTSVLQRIDETHANLTSGN